MREADHARRGVQNHRLEDAARVAFGLLEDFYGVYGSFPYLGEKFGHVGHDVGKVETAPGALGERQSQEVGHVRRREFLVGHPLGGEPTLAQSRELFIEMTHHRRRWWLGPDAIEISEGKEHVERLGKRLLWQGG